MPSSAASQLAAAQSELGLAQLNLKRQTELRYRAFGLTRLNAGTQKTAYRYTGQRIEGGTDLYYYGARWYDPVVGRFLQADTIVPNAGNPQDLYRYTYVRNNPIAFLDPAGEEIFLFIDQPLKAGDAITVVARCNISGKKSAALEWE